MTWLAGAVIAFAGPLALLTTGCGSHESKTPFAAGNAEQMRQTQREAAANYAAYMQSHPRPQGQ